MDTTMLKRLFFFLVLFIWLPISSGQVNIDLKSGYIINLQHDSIFGNIVEFPYEYLSTRMVFIENGNDRKIQYTPEDLTGFHIDPDKDFIVMTMAEKEREGFVETKYFAMKAVEGEIELIILSLNDQKEQFFVSRENFGLSKLEQIIEIKDGFKYTFGRYKTTLGKYF